MDLLILLTIILSVLIGVGRAVDLALFTDPVSGLCTVGSVWLRYAALAVALAVAVLAGRRGARKPQRLCGSCKPAGALALLGAVWMALAGVTKIIFGSAPLTKGIWGALAICCGGWLCTLGRSWLGKRWKQPTDSLAEAVAGSALFYWCVLTRFMENSSSWHRVAPTATVWQMLAALVFLSALARALYLPESTNGKTLCAGGLASFALCLCWELPQLAANLPTGLDELPEFFFGLGLCCIGALGLVCTLRCAGKQTAHSQHSVG